MAPAYKLTYFNGRGLAESIRFLFKYGGIEFEDIRITDDEWPALKEKTPLGQLPVLEHNGKKMGQSVAIARYVAKQLKLVGDDDWENLEIDAIVDTIQDLKNKLRVVNHEQDESRKKTLKEQTLAEIIPNYLSRLDSIVQKNNGHLAAGKLTWADFYFASVVTNLDIFVNGDALEKYPHLKAVVDDINNLPAIKNWLQVRPKTVF